MVDKSLVFMSKKSPKRQNEGEKKKFFSGKFPIKENCQKLPFGGGVGVG
jgi:hypothetical protein